MKSPAPLFAVVLTLLLAPAVTAAPRAPLPTVPQVDLKRYAGTWFEIARLPTPFQRNDERAWAQYTLAPDGSVTVVNTAVKQDGSDRRIRGRALPVPGSNNARLRVNFGGLAALVPAAKEGNYWIIDLDQRQYRYALVGTPDRKFLWLLARTPDFSRAEAKRILSKANALGFATDRVLWDRVR